MLDFKNVTDKLLHFTFIEIGTSIYSEKKSCKQKQKIILLTLFVLIHLAYFNFLKIFQII